MADRPASVRRATAADVDGIVALWKAFVAELEPQDPRYGAQEGAYAKWRDYFLKRMVDSSQAAVFVADDDGDLVGVVEARIMGGHPVFKVGTHGHLFGHFVQASHRGHGLGPKLVVAAEAWFREIGLPHYRIVVLKHFDGLAAMYESIGMSRAECTYEKRL